MQMRFPAVRGRMGTREYYVAMLPLKVLPRLFRFDDGRQLPPEQRAQRKLNKKRVPEITRYILDHEDDWVFSSLTASFPSEETFEESDFSKDIGILSVPLDMEFLVNDGQHRKAAIEKALEQNAMLGSQTISVVLFPEEGLERNQQMFSDLNRTVQKTSRSLDILYDHRDPMNQITLAVADSVPVFRGRVEKDAVSLAVKSPKFVTLSALYDANTRLLNRVAEADVDQDGDLISEATELAAGYWDAVTNHIEQWRLVRDGDLKPSEARAEYVHAHAVAFWALGSVGRELLRAYPRAQDWEARLAHLGEIDWRKTNREWQGICMLGTDIITRRQTKDAMTKYITWKLGLSAEKPQPVLEVASTREQQPSLAL
jgi:DNA sulfur modification protein DndB